MTIHERITVHYMTRLLANPRGRAFVLSQMATAEDSDEAQIFDVLLSRVDDPELQKMIARHRDDEKRHARMFRACVERIGVDVPPIPSELKLIDRIDAALGRFFDREIRDATGVMQAYVLLQVIEERAVTQFTMYRPIFERFDPFAAATIAEVARDEERHLRYCHAIARRYAPDEFTHARTLRRYRSIEARAFAENGRANMRFTIENGLVNLHPVEKLFYRGMARLGERRGATAPTPFFGEGPDSTAVSLAELSRAA